MKLLRYRKPSFKTITGITRVKRQVKRDLGISQMQGWTQLTRLKQKAKYRLGLYSPTVRTVRNTAHGRFPSILGFFRRIK